MEEMNEISNQLFSNNMLGLIVASIIFIITIVLLARKLIGLVVTVILLFFAIISGIAIAHNDIVREYLKSKSVPSTTNGHEISEDIEAKFDKFKDYMNKKFEEIEDYFTKEKKKEEK